tara:strand:- start:379 stop:684 length:306 start_codon:yes stop_codon:yes gene_type:complete
MLVGINSLLVFGIGILHFIDTFTTMYLVYGGHGEEANPILAPALAAGPLAFILIKGFVAFLTVGVFWVLRSEKNMIFVYLIVGYLFLSETISQFEIISNIP